jgi:predicted ATPase
MITRIEATNYRCLRNVSQGLDQFHVIAGPNGSGKSTFLEVLVVLGAFATDGLENVWHESRVSQFEELLFRGEGKSFALSVEIKIPEEILDKLRRKNGNRRGFVRYEVEVGRSHGAKGAGQHERDVQILAENLWLMEHPADVSRADVVQSEFAFPSASVAKRSVIHSTAPKGWRKVASKSHAGNAYFRSETGDWNFTLKNPAGRSALSTLPEDERFGVANWAKQMLSSSVQKLMLRSEAMQKACGPLKERRFLPDGSTLPLVVAALRKTESRFQPWLDHVRTVLPITDVRVVEREDDKHSYLVATYESGVQVPSWHLSDGTLRLLALTLLPYLSNAGSIYLIEEPENGIHPQGVEAVFQSLSSIYGGQALVATHSPVLVGLISPKQLLCFSRTPTGETDIVRGDTHPRLKEWQGKFNLAQLFAAGVLS